MISTIHPSQTIGLCNCDKLTIGQKVWITIGRSHRQYERIKTERRGQSFKGSIDWINEANPSQFEVRISRKHIVWLGSTTEQRRRDFLIRVELLPVDCYNFSDVKVALRG